MARKLILQVIVIVVGCAIASCQAAKSATDHTKQPPAVGEKAADFGLDTLDGGKVQLSELITKGPVVVVQLRGWNGYQCPVCTEQTGNLLAKEQEFAAKNASVVLIYPGSGRQLGERAGEFIADMQLPDHFRFVTDPDMKFAESWGLRWDAPGETAYPSTFVIDSEGVVRFAKVSKTHGDRAETNDVLAALPGK